MTAFRSCRPGLGLRFGVCFVLAVVGAGLGEWEVFICLSFELAIRLCSCYCVVIPGELMFSSLLV